MRNLKDWRDLCRVEETPRGGSLYRVGPFWVRATFEGDRVLVQAWGQDSGHVSRPKPWELDRVRAALKSGRVLLPCNTPTVELKQLQAARRIEHPDGKSRWIFPRGGPHPLYAVLAHVLAED